MTQEKIKQAALHIFASKGYHNTTMQEIAAEVGIRPSTIYVHFDSKEQLFIEIVKNVKTEYSSNFTDIKNSVDKNTDYNPKEILYLIFARSINYFSTNEVEFMLWKRVVLFPPEELIPKLELDFFVNYKSMFGVYSKIFKKAIELQMIVPTDINTLVLSFIALINGYLTEMVLYKIKLKEERLEDAWILYWNGIKSGGIKLKN